MHGNDLIASGIHLGDLIREPELRLLFESSIMAGLTSVSISDGSRILLSCGSDCRDDGELFTMHKALYLEGEETGEIMIEGPVQNRGLVESIGELVYDAVRAILLSSYRTLLVAEARKIVSSQSYEELIDRNSRLSESEGRYRQLSEKLRLQIQSNLAELKAVKAELSRCRDGNAPGKSGARANTKIHPALNIVSENLRSLKKCLSGIKRMVSQSIRTAAGRETCKSGGRSDEKHLQHIRDANLLVMESIKNIEYIKSMVSGSAGSSGTGKKISGMKRKRSGGNNGKRNIDS